MSKPLPSEGRGRAFESHRVHQSFQIVMTFNETVIVRQQSHSNHLMRKCSAGLSRKQTMSTLHKLHPQQAALHGNLDTLYSAHD